MGFKYKAHLIYDKYLILTNGKLYSTISKKILRPKIDNDGYQRVGLSCSDKSRNDIIHVHRLVAQTYFSNPENKKCANHINHIKSDNRLKKFRMGNSF